MASVDTVKLSEDHTDDLLYFARTGELSDLQSAVEDLSKAHTASPAAVLAGAIDEGSGNTVLHMAAANGHDEIISYVLAKIRPTEPNISNTFASTSSTQPESSTLNSSTSTVSTPHDSSSQDTLPASDSPSSIPLLDHPNSSLSTPLHWAALNGHLSSVRLLADAGADMNAENAAKHDALDEAERAGRKDVVRFLMARMSGKSEEEIKELETQNEGDVKATQEDLERLGLDDDAGDGS